MALPFYPTGWAPALAAATAFAAYRKPRAGLALALAAPVLPLGNHALGLALLYGVLALGWLVLFWRNARWGLAFLAGPALAAVGLLALVPLIVVGIGSAVRRAAQTVVAVAVAGVVAGLRGVELPFGRGGAPSPDLAGAESAVTAARVLLDAVPGGLALEALALVAVAVALPLARTPWRLAAIGAAMLAATLLVAPAAPALSFVLAAWLTVGGLALKSAR
jgi:hypothetical protein